MAGRNKGRPSYEDGQFRDPTIRRLQRERAPQFNGTALKRLIRKAVPSKRARSPDEKS